MLTRSPVPPSPANSSPRGSHHSFHYASAASHHQSPSRISVLLPRRQSSSSASGGAMPSSPAYPRPKRYVGVDAATQYSPMEPDSPAVANLAPPLPPESQLAPPQTLGTMSVTQPDEEPLRSQQADSTPSSSKQSHQPEPSHTASPIKRRNSQGPGGGNAVSATASITPSILAKRVKPDTAPPKVLPEKYELCPVEDIVVLIANMLGELIETNDALALKSGHLTRFHSRYDKVVCCTSYPCNQD